MSYPKRPWKKSFRRIPSTIRHKLEEIGNAPVRVVGARRIPREEIAAGHFDPLGIRLNAEGSLILSPDPVIPPSENGTWAKRNHEGWAITRRDLPKVWRSFSHEAPNFGDYSRGTHDCSYEKECYQREVIPPLGVAIRVSLHKEEEGFFHLLFEMNQALLPDEEMFDRLLLLWLNLMQESTGCSDVIVASESYAEAVAQRYIDWEIFPAGCKETANRFAERVEKLSGEKQREFKDRYRLLESLGPINWVIGNNLGSSAYFGAQFADDMVVFENINFGNAAYVLYEDWKEMSKLSRTELLRDENSFDRIVHSKGWEKRLVFAIRRALGKSQ